MPSYADKQRTPAPKDFAHVDDASNHEHNGEADRQIDGFGAEKPYQPAIKDVPVTVERFPYGPQEGDRLVDPGVARANIAASNERPNGTTEYEWNKRHQHQTVMQQHADYWDPDLDGVIWPTDVYDGFRAWGWSIPLSLYAVFLINSFLSYPTNPSILPDPFFRIYIPRMHKNRHGSDSQAWDNEGRFRPQQFEELWTKYDKDNKGGFTLWDLWNMHKGQRFAFDFFGWSASFFEWVATYLLLWPEDGIMRKEDVRKVYDGSMFQMKADEYTRKHGPGKAYRHREAIRAKYAKPERKPHMVEGW